MGYYRVMINHALFQVSLKAIVRKDNKLLTLRTPTGYVDFAGGRINEEEINLDNKTALLRELKEELGEQVQANIDNVLFVVRRDYTSRGKTSHIIAIYYNAVLANPDAIIISDEHVSYEWLTIDELLALKDLFMSQDEYTQFAKYFKNI